MHPSKPLARVLGAALLALPLGLLSAPASAQATCSSRTECVEKGIPFTNQDPGVSFGSPADTVYEARQDVEVFVADAWGLDEYSRSLTVAGGTLLTQGWRWNKPVTSAWMVGTVQLVPGGNVLTARICDLTSRCTQATRTVVYQVPPPPPSRTAAVLRNVYRAENRNLATCDGCGEAVLQYTTPEYVSMDQPRSVTLFYSSSQASPRGFVEVEALERSPEAAAYMTLEIMQPGGALMTLDNGTTRQYYRTGSGANRLAASFDASNMTTGMYTFTAVVTSYWSDGTHTPPVQTSVRVPVVNERGSRFGAGWTVAGLERLHIQSDGILLTDGAGKVQWFASGGCTASACVYTSPPGEAGTLTRVLPNDYYVRSRVDGSETHFFGGGNVALHRDRFGNTVSFEYDGGTWGMPTAVVDPAGMRMAFTYHPGGYLRSLRDPAGRESYVWYMGIDVWQIHSPDARLALDSMSYTDHRLTGWTDARRGRWSLTYDAAGRVQRTEAPAVTDGGVTARATVTVRSRESAVLPQPGTGTAALMARPVPPDTAVLVIASAGDTTRVWSDAWGLAARVRTEDGTTALRRNGNGQVTSLDDGKGTAISFDDQTGRPWAVTRVTAVAADGGGTWTFGYGAYGALNRVTEVDGPVIDHVLDALGRRTATLRGADTVAWYTYDASGRPLTTRDAKQHTATYTYQPSGTRNLASVTTDGVTTQHRYDAVGRPVRTVTATSAGDSVAYDVMNRVASVTASVGTMRFGFGVNGVDLDDVVDPLGQRYQFRHNVVGWVTQEIDPGGRTALFGYYPATGTARTGTDRRGNTIAFTYDEQGRPLTRTADGAATTWRYDPAGRWAVVANAASYDSINYDSEGKVTRTVTWRGGLEFSIHHTYDAANRPDSVIVAGAWGSSASVYMYDRFGRMDGIRDPAGRWTELFYNQEGMVDSLRLPTVDTARTLFRYDARHQLSSTLSETLNQTRQYGYSALGQVLRDSISSGTVGWQHDYGYDALGRIASWELHRFGRKRVCYNIRECSTIDTDSLAQSLAFSWDAVGNPSGATRDPGNRVRAHGGYSLEYDLDGNLVRKYNASGFNQTFTWNALGQLTATDRPGVGWAAFQYDGRGRRVRRQDHTGAVTHYVYDGDDLVLEVDGAGNRIRDYTYLPGIDQPHSMRQWASGAGGAIFYYQMQKPGHVSGLVNTSNQLVNEYRYTPFGTPVNGYPVQGTPNPLQYMARELDGLAGLYYVRNRWYDPQQGRFISEDPIGLEGGINQYAYVGGNPISRRDPSGLCHDGGNLLSSGYSQAPLGDGSGYWEFRHRNQLYHGHSAGQYYTICSPGSGWDDAWAMFRDFMNGSGPLSRTFRQGSVQAAEMRFAPGVNGARNLLCSKFNAGNRNPDVTDYGARFGLLGPFRAWRNATRQFVGSYNVNIHGNGDGTATFFISNATTMESLLYHIPGVPSYERNAINQDLSRVGVSLSLPGGNMYQTITWTETLAETCR